MFEGTTIMDFCEFFSYTSYEVFLLLELVSPVLASITIWRLMTRPGAVIRIIIVIHSNIILWCSALIMLGTHSCKGPGVARYWDNFILSIPLTAAINLVAALHNDQFYPVAKLSVKEAKEFFAHLKSSQPSIKLISVQNGN